MGVGVGVGVCVCVCGCVFLSLTTGQEVFYRLLHGSTQTQQCFFTEIWLVYSVVFISAVQPDVSVIHACTFSFIFFYDLL